MTSSSPEHEQHEQPEADLDPYSAWLAAEGRLPTARLVSRRREMAHQPLISVMMPVFDPEIPYLRRAINSVQGQSWDRWELCIVDDASTNPAVRLQLEGIAASDPRVKVRFRANNGHICHASNEALALCAGDYVALFDHDDLLHPDALQWVAEAICHEPGLDLVFTDEDKVDGRDRHYDPHFKHQLNLDILWSQNFLSHLGVYRRQLMEKVGGFRPGFEGSQDHDLVLRVLEETSLSRVRHVPKVLYHWRASPGSTAQSHGAKGYAYLAGRRAVQEHLTRSGRQARVDPTSLGGVYRVRHLPATPLPKVGLALVGSQRPGLHVDAVVATLTACKKVTAEVVVSASEGAFERIDQATADRYRRHRLHRQDPDHANVAKLINDAVAQAGGEVVVVLAPHLRPRIALDWASPAVPAAMPEEWLVELIKQAMRPDVGVVGGRLVDCHQRVESAGMVLGCDNIVGRRQSGLPPAHCGYMMRAALVQEVSAVSASCMAMRRDVWEQLGGMDLRFRDAYYDVDLCMRARRLGLKVVFTPWSTLQMSHPLEDAAVVWPAGLALLIHKHVRALRDEPFLSPHLRLAAGALVLARPAAAGRAAGVGAGEVTSWGAPEAADPAEAKSSSPGPLHVALAGPEAGAPSPAGPS